MGLYSVYKLGVWGLDWVEVDRISGRGLGGWEICSFEVVSGGDSVLGERGR